MLYNKQLDPIVSILDLLAEQLILTVYRPLLDGSAARPGPVLPSGAVSQYHQCTACAAQPPLAAFHENLLLIVICTASISLYNR